MGNRYFSLRVPTTLPTFDEVLGREGVDRENYNEYLISLMRGGVPQRVNHPCRGGRHFLPRAVPRFFAAAPEDKKDTWCPLGELLLPDDQIPRATLGRQRLEGKRRVDFGFSLAMKMASGE